MEDRYDLLDGILLFCAGLGGSRDRTCSMYALCELVTRIWSQKRYEQAHVFPSRQMRSAREYATLAARWKVVKGSKRS